MVLANSWRDVRARFLEGADEYPSLSAQWDASEGKWAFLDGSVEAEGLFEEITRIAISILAESRGPEIRAHASTLRKPCYAWLDFMRRQQRGFQRAKGRPPGWRQLSHYAELDALASLIGTSLSGIAQVFKESADLCADLAVQARMFEPRLNQGLAPISRSLEVNEFADAKLATRVDLSQRQWDLLRTIVDKYQLNDSTPFHVTQNVDGFWINYSPGPGTRLVFGDLDELRRQNLIHLEGTRNFHRGWPTQSGMTAAYGSVVSANEPRPYVVVDDPNYWRSRREDFESLPPGDYSLLWSTRPPTTLTGKPLASHWTWGHCPDEGLKARVGAIALKCAKGLGRDSEDGWFDELRTADFVGFRLGGSGRQKQQDGSFVEYEGGALKDVVKHSITLCHILEAGALQHGVEAATPKLSADADRLSQASKSVLAPSVGGDPLKTSETSPNTGLTWEDVEIRFLSDERVQIVTSGIPETRNYAEFGFEDGRSEKPNLAWGTFRLLAEQTGTIRPSVNGPERAALEKRIQEIRQRLRNRFDAPDDPLPFIDGKGYQARFKIGCAPSYNS